MDDEEYEDEYDFAEELRGSDPEGYVLYQRIRTGIVVAIVVALLAFFTVGCSTLSSDELFAQASACETDCQELWDEWNRREEKRLEKEREEAPAKACNNAGGIMYCQSRSGDKRCTCVSRASIREILGY